jgi:hypothetical protein
MTSRKISVNAWCEACQVQSTFITTGEAARLSGVSAREIYRRVEANECHSMDTEDGELLVCRRSL